MGDSKYFYNDIPLAEYCRIKELNVSTIRTRIWKKKQSKKYQNFSEQEIVNMVVESAGSGIKYWYKEQTLRQYCLENEINFETIISRITTLKKTNKNLTNDQLVIMAMEEFENKNYRFFWEGVPLIEYCEAHPEINYKTIVGFIRNEKEKNLLLTDSELIEKYLIKEHKGIYIYYYCGIPLKQYCEENELNYKNIISYMSRYRKTEKFKDLSNNEFVEAIMDQYQPFEPKYLYDGLTLRNYCEKNNISYYSIVSFIKRSLLKGSKKTVDELIEEGIKTINRHGIIYYYKGIPLKDYARENNLNVGSIRSAILKKKINCNKPLQEIVNECVEAYQRLSVKYIYEDESLWLFCKKIGLSYSTVISKYLREYKDKDEISKEEGIARCVEYYLKNPPIKTKYFYEDETLFNYCKFSGISYYAVITKYLSEYENKKEITIDEGIKLAVEYYQKNPTRQSKFFYNGELLVDYCRRTGLSYQTVISKYIKEYSDKPNVDVLEAIKEIIEYYEKNPPVKTKYYYDNQTLARFCDKNGYSYAKVTNRLRRILDKNISYSEAINQSLEKAEKKLKIDKIVETFERIKNNQEKDLHEWREICDFLKIDFLNVIELLNMGFSYQQAINMIWYFYDKSENDLKVISDKKLESLFSLVEKLMVASENELKEFDLYDLIGIYKSKLYDSRNEILISRKNYLNHTIFSLCKAYNIDINKNNFEDFQSEIKLYFIKFIDRTCLNNPGQIIKYMDLTVKGYLRKYLKDYYNQRNVISLNQSKYSKNDEHSPTLIENIEDSNQTFEVFDKSEFSSEMLAVLADLDKEDMLFINLKFLEDYTDYELSKYFKMSITEVRNKEMEILSLLRDKPAIAKLKIKRRDDY